MKDFIADTSKVNAKTNLYQMTGNMKEWPTLIFSFGDDNVSYKLPPSAYTIVSTLDTSVS